MLYFFLLLFSICILVGGLKIVIQIYISDLMLDRKVLFLEQRVTDSCGSENPKLKMGNYVLFFLIV